MNTQITRHQHIIPAMIQKRHASEIRQPARHSKINKVEYGKTSEVIIKDTGYQDYLYELIAQGQLGFNSVNYIENRLSVVEDHANHIFDKLEQRQQLKNEDWNWLYLFVALQMLRTPEALNMAANFLHTTCEDFPNNNWDNMARLFCLAVSPDSVLLEWTIQMLTEYNVFCFETSTPLTIGLQFPVLYIIDELCYISNTPLALVYPFSKYHYLIFTKGAFTQFYNQATNEMVNITNNICKKLNVTFYRS